MRQLDSGQRVTFAAPEDTERQVMEVQKERGCGIAEAVVWWALRNTCVATSEQLPQLVIQTKHTSEGAFAPRSPDVSVVGLYDCIPSQMPVTIWLERECIVMKEEESGMRALLERLSKGCRDAEVTVGAGNAEEESEREGINEQEREQQRKLVAQKGEPRPTSDFRMPSNLHLLDVSVLLERDKVVGQMMNLFTERGIRLKLQVTKNYAFALKGGAGEGLIHVRRVQGVLLLDGSVVLLSEEEADIAFYQQCKGELKGAAFHFLPFENALAYLMGEGVRREEVMMQLVCGNTTLNEEMVGGIILELFGRSEKSRDIIRRFLVVTNREPLWHGSTFHSLIG